MTWVASSRTAIRGRLAAIAARGPQEHNPKNSEKDAAREEGLLHRANRTTSNFYGTEARG